MLKQGENVIGAAIIKRNLFVLIFDHLLIKQYQSKKEKDLFVCLAKILKQISGIIS